MKARISLLARLRVWLWLRKARRLLAAGRAEEAASWCESALEFDPALGEAREMLREIRREAIRRGRERIEREPDDAEALLELADWLLLDERSEEAAELVRRVLRRTRWGAESPPGRRRSELLLLRGRIDCCLGRFAEALAELEATSAAGRTNPENAYYRGLCHLGLGEEARARACFAEVARQHFWAIEERLREYVERAGAEVAR